jgi:ABC-type glycerol-3-phosphate transport system permease component
MFITKRFERIPEMENQLSVSPKTQTRDLPFWRWKSFQQTSHKVLVYTLLFGLSIIVLMPMSWMITAALRPRGDLVYTIPPQWFPTIDFHFENFWLVLINKQFPLLRPTLNTLLLIDLNIAGVLGTYKHFILPLCKPVLVVMTVFTFQGVWNDFVGTLLYVSDEAKFTLAIALAYFRAQSTHAATKGASTSVHLLMAGTMLVAIPPLLLYFFVQKRLIGGIARLGLKG